MSDPDAVAWLETLVWPDQPERLTRLQIAIDRARADPPQLVAGDLFDEVDALVERAAQYGTVIVFHSAVIVYLTPEHRAAFDRKMRRLVAAGLCHWVSNEADGVLPSVTGAAPVPVTRFVLGVDGTRVALTQGHGAHLEWDA